MHAKKNYDVLIIGSGPGGYVAAIRSAQLGFKTAIIEKEHLGGICLNWGCIPTKALLRSAEVYHYMLHAQNFGLSAQSVQFDLGKIIDRSRKIATQLSSGVSYLMKKNRIDVLFGTALLVKQSGQTKVLLKTKDDSTEKVYQAQHIILATGARARVFPDLSADGQSVWTYKEALRPKVLPKSLLVVGSGAIGCEFASFYATLGVKTSLVELQDRILPVEDEEISAFVEKSFQKSGINIFTGTQIDSLKKEKGEMVARYQDQQNQAKMLRAEKVILALGVTGNIENLGLEALGIKTDKGHIVTDAYCRTNVKGIYAIGDVTGGPWLAHKASHEGVLCMEAIAGQKPTPLDRDFIPGCTYCRPQIASIGLTEKQARAKRFSIRVGRFPFTANGKAIALGETEGFIKTIFDQKTGALLGAHMVGSEVTELIQGYATAMRAELVDMDFMHTIFAHPTLSEMMHESVLDAHKRALHIL